MESKSSQIQNNCNIISKFEEIRSYSTSETRKLSMLSTDYQQEAKDRENRTNIFMNKLEIFYQSESIFSTYGNEEFHEKVEDLLNLRNYRQIEQTTNQEITKSVGYEQFEDILPDNISLSTQESVNFGDRQNLILQLRNDAKKDVSIFDRIIFLYKIYNPEYSKSKQELLDSLSFDELLWITNSYSYQDE